jgi:hypothetical protein
VGAQSTYMYVEQSTYARTYILEFCQFNLGVLIGICHDHPAVLFYFQRSKSPLIDFLEQFYYGQLLLPNMWCFPGERSKTTKKSARESPTVLGGRFGRKIFGDIFNFRRLRLVITYHSVYRAVDPKFSSNKPTPRTAAP